jgi:NAD+ kinase
MDGSLLKHVTLVQNLTTDPDNYYTDQVLSFMKLHGVDVSLLTVQGKDYPVVPETATKPDVVIVLGGDGTFLRTARQFVAQGVPLVGVNTGTLGFLTHIDVKKLHEYLNLLIQGAYKIEERTMLSIRSQENGHVVEDLALNDVVVKNANPSQLCTLRLYVDNTLVAIYDADGLILSTPSGSTAYTMAAGGPVISPEVDAISITPICPHSFSAKAVVVPLNKEFRVESDTKNYDVVYAVDGLECGILTPGQFLTVCRSSITCRMINFERDDDDFYVLLKRKLHWAMNPRWLALESSEAE